MRIQLTAETRHGQPGQVIDVSAEEAKRLLEAGQAEPVSERPVEKAEKR